MWAAAFRRRKHLLHLHLAFAFWIPLYYWTTLELSVVLLDQHYQVDHVHW
jgi:hypothetical protein